MAKLSDIEKAILNALGDKAVLNLIGTTAVRAIKRRTKTGKGVPDNFARSQKLPEFKQSTIKRRQYAKRAGELTGEGATVKKTNVTRTGELLNSVTYEISGNSVDIKLKDDANVKKAGHLLGINKGYQFMRVSKNEFRQLTEVVSARVSAAIKRLKINQL